MAMEFLSIHSEPELRNPTLVAAFEGWPDAGEVASGALRYLVRNLGATRFAELARRSFTSSPRSRPHSIQLRPGQRTLRWPINDFYYWINPTGEQRSAAVHRAGAQPALGHLREGAARPGRALRREDAGHARRYL